MTTDNNQIIDDSETGSRQGGKPLTVITVNRRSVSILGPRVTGADVKAAAMAQGVAIDAMFQLSMQEPDGKWAIVGDADTITVNKNSVFRAVADDDNS